MVILFAVVDTVVIFISKLNHCIYLLGSMSLQHFFKDSEHGFHSVLVELHNI